MPLEACIPIIASVLGFDLRKSESYYRSIACPKQALEFWVPEPGKTKMFMVWIRIIYPPLPNESLYIRRTSHITRKIIISHLRLYVNNKCTQYEDLNKTHRYYFFWVVIFCGFFNLVHLMTWNFMQVLVLRDDSDRNHMFWVSVSI